MYIYIYIHIHIQTRKAIKPFKAPGGSRTPCLNSWSALRSPWPSLRFEKLSGLGFSFGFRVWGLGFDVGMGPI